MQIMMKETEAELSVCYGSFFGGEHSCLDALHDLPFTRVIVAKVVVRDWVSNLEERQTKDFSEVKLRTDG